jgi:hypothetical protein
MIIEELYETNQVRTFNGCWGISQLGGCQRALLAYARPSLAPVSLGGQWAIAADEGRLHEADVVSRLRQRGYAVIHAGADQRTVTCVTDETTWPLEGHPDGHVDIPPWYLLEVKSKNDEYFRRFKKLGPVKQSFFKEYVQVQGYLFSPEVTADGITSCLYIAKNRSSGKLYEEIIRGDPKWFHDFLLIHFSPVLEAYQHEDPLESLPCSTDDYARQWCPLRFWCSGAIEKSVPAVSDAGLAEAVEKAQRAKQLEQESEALKQEANTAIKNFLIKNGMKKATVDGVPVQIVGSTRKSLKIEEVAEIVPEEEMKKLVHSTSYEYVKVG